MMRKFILACAAAVLTLSGSVCLGQDTLLDELYGRGVHAYFARNYRGAHELLTAAITSGSVRHATLALITPGCRQRWNVTVLPRVERPGIPRPPAIPAGGPATR